MYIHTHHQHPPVSDRYIHTCHQRPGTPTHTVSVLQFLSSTFTHTISIRQFQASTSRHAISLLQFQTSTSPHTISLLQFRQVHPHKRLIKRPCPAIPSCRHRWLERWLPPHDTGQSPATKNIYNIPDNRWYTPYTLWSGVTYRLVYNAHITGLHPTPLAPFRLVSWLLMHITTLHTHTLSVGHLHINIQH